MTVNALADKFCQGFFIRFGDRIYEEELRLQHEISDITQFYAEIVSELKGKGL